MTTSENLIVYNASAGSGKTYTLALEFVSLSLSTPDPKHFRRVLAITFTNKAAHELKERIITYTAECITAPASNGIAEFVMQKADIDHHTLQARAHAAHRAMLYQYSDLHVSTIDHFVLSILRAFSKELDLSFDFAVELDEQRVLEWMTQSILDQVGTDAFITEQLAELVKQNLDDDRGWNPSDSMAQAISLLMNEESVPYRKQLVELGEEQLKEQLTALGSETKTIWKQIEEAQSRARTAIESKGLSKDDFSGKAKGFISYAYKDYRTASPPTAKQYEKVCDGSLYTGKSDRAADIDSLRDLFIETMGAILESLDRLQLLDRLYRNRIYLILALRAEEVLRRLETEEGLTLLKDNNRKIADLIADNPTPFIYERIGERYHHYLIDEFQDTSVLQWRNMLPLLDNALSYERKNFLVGDVKQSIYRWRGGDPKQMADLPSVPGQEDKLYLRQIAQNLKRSIVKRDLAVNYRSSRAVIEFNNALFTQLVTALNEDDQKIYAGLEQGVHHHDKLGYVQARIIDEDETLEERLPHLLEIISQCAADGYAGSDICVLSRSNKDGRLIAQYLNEQGLSVSSPDSLLLSGHADIQLLMCYLEVISGSVAPRPYLFILDRLLKRAGRDGELDKRIASMGSVMQSSYLNELHRDLGMRMNLRDYKDRDVYYALDSLVSDLAFDPSDAYIHELLNQALGHLQRADNSMAAFVTYWREKQNTIAVKTGVDSGSIQIMTVHKSKGLQFPVVIMPYMNWKTRNDGKKKIWVKPEGTPLDIGLLDLSSSLEGSAYEDRIISERSAVIMDELNTLYVAFTRPESRLYVDVVNSSREGMAKQLSAYIRTQDPRGELMLGDLGQKKRASDGAIEEQSTPLTLLPYTRGERNTMLSIALGKDEHREAKKNMGTAIHEILEDCGSADEIPALTQQLLPLGEYTDEEREFAQEAANTAYALELNQDWQHERYSVLKEVELLDTEGRLYRIDKLYIDDTAKSAIVIDYKTGLASEHDQRQMKGYKSLLQSMGYETKSYLLYTERAEIEEV